NLPVFFWLKQDEDVARAKANLQAARSDQALIKIQTAAAVATLFRSAQFAYQTAILYRDSLIPLARQNLRVALTAYQSGKIDFVTLSGALQREYAARVSYLQAANQFLAGEVSLEQAIGAPPHDRRAVRIVANRRCPLRRHAIVRRYLHHHGADSGRVSRRSARVDYHRHLVHHRPRPSSAPDDDDRPG